MIDEEICEEIDERFMTPAEAFPSLQASPCGLSHGLGFFYTHKSTECDTVGSNLGSKD